MGQTDSGESSAFRGKIVAVTGAAGRLGSHVVERLLQGDARVAALVLNDAEAAQLPPHRHLTSFQVNVTDPDSVADGMAAIIREFGALDGLIHTVGGWAMTPLLESSVADWNRILALNLTSTFLCCREAARVMRSGGALVAITAGQGVDRGVGGQAAYSAAKAGVMRLLEAASEELADRGIRTLAVAPSMILFDPESTEKGVQVADVVQACLSSLLPDGPPTGATVRVYGTLQ